jgi:type III secretion system FlhB-like substrate exporter
MLCVCVCVCVLFDERNVIQDDWIKMEVVMTYNRSVVDNLVPTKIEETLPNFFYKKNPIILDILSNT